MARRIKYRQQKNAIPYIVGAGITEQWYFTHIQPILGIRVKVRPRFFGQEDVFQLNKKIETILADGGFVIAVFDADVASWDEKENKKLEAMKKRYCNNSSVILCDSLPSIEYWFLLHFADIHRMFKTSESVIKELDKYLPGFNKSENYLSRSRWVEMLCSDNKMSQAIEYSARSGIGQSYTNIPKAFQILKNQSK